ncbi:MAG TPA: translation initiation factor IF-2 [Candidatus Saccharimonadales bacterium]
MSETVKINSTITVGELAERLGIEATELITSLVKSGVMATLNDVIDFETAAAMVSELGLETKLERQTDEKPPLSQRQTRQATNLQPRPPVVAVMGHVDHGKTTLLDAIRNTAEVEAESGGITQHISAYQVTHNGRVITFLDTPGHEAFASLRQHGAYLTDLVLLVVAADDGVKPQTKEAIKYAVQAGVKIMVAINKVDKSAANIDRVKQELADTNLTPEEWGGDTVTVEVSALKKEGLGKLLDMVLLVTDVEELTADIDGPAEGLVIESHMERGRGPVVTVLVEHGLLRAGDFIQAGQTYGKARTVEDFEGNKLSTAGSSTPATVTGLKELPNFGVTFTTHNSEKQAKAAALKYTGGAPIKSVASTGSELLAQIHKDRSSQELPMLIKADVKGSGMSVIESVMSLGSEEVSPRVVGSGVGSIKESDISMASASHAIIYGFNVDLPANLKRLAMKEGVEIRIYKVIYELIDNVKAELESMLLPKVVEDNIGRLIIKGVFNTTKNEVICGGEVTKGEARTNTTAKIFRDEELIGEAEVESVKKGPDEVNSVGVNELCGLKLKTTTKVALKEGDRIEFFTRETVKRKL